MYPEYTVRLGSFAAEPGVIQFVPGIGRTVGGTDTGV
jgi:hypothetical protein